MDAEFNPFSLKGKSILITGASSGIGKATAINCSRMGATIVATGRNVECLADTMKQLDGKGHICIPSDLTAQDGIASIVETTPYLDGIVHCAGIGHRKPCKAIDAEDINVVVSNNFTSAVLLQSALLASKKINKGASIVFISSRTADIPTIANSLYSASKGAIRSYSKCLSLELAPKQIRVNCISPAMVWTNLITADGADIEQLEKEQRKYPLKRYGQPEDIANLAIYLLSDAASWMTGSCIDITGGSIEL